MSGGFSCNWTNDAPQQSDVNTFSRRSASKKKVNTCQISSRKRLDSECNKHGATGHRQKRRPCHQRAKPAAEGRCHCDKPVERQTRGLREIEVSADASENDKPTSEQQEKSD